MLAAAIADTIGTAILIYGGTGVAIAGVPGQPVAGNAYDSPATPLAFGLAMLIVVTSIATSPAPRDPAVTLGLAAADRFPWRYVPAYLAAQLSGLIARQRAFATQMLRATNAGHDAIADAAAATATRPGPQV